MRWLWFVGSLACFAILFRTTSIALALLSLVGALAFMLIGTLAVAVQRIDRTRTEDVRLLGPDELRHIREKEARRQAEHQQTEPEQAEPAPTEPTAGSQSTAPAIVGLASAAAMIDEEMARREAAPQPGGSLPIASPALEPTPQAPPEPQPGTEQDPDQVGTERIDPRNPLE